ncbi:solute carrier family 45 member 3-like isoform X2 [Dermacentor albipictus]|uniref:solute carrier family 45 member 3-like isoform X2 n=1 Tax=Dermacentor albipictus TaxID=60249 RepID=UPI0038FC8B38
MAAPITTVAEGVSRMEASARDRSSVPVPGFISTSPGMKSNSTSSNTTDSGSAAAMSSRSWRQLPWIVGINLVAFGAHLCACGCFVYLPPMLRKAGFSEKSRGVILGLGPFLCIVGVPLVGAWSDRCRSRLGRRRPFLLGLGLLLALALASIAFIDLISATAVQGPVLAAATIVLDFATQALLNPSQSLLYDLVADVEYGFSVYSFTLSLGGLFGYLLSALDWTDTILGQAGQERAVFILMLVALTSCLAVTFVLAKEKPLPPVKATEAVANGDAVRPPPPCALVILDKAPQGGVAGSCLPVVCNGNGAAVGEPGTPSHNHSPLNGAGVFITWHHVGSSKAKASPATVLRALSSALLVLVCEAFCRVFVVMPARAASYLLRIPINLRRLFLFQLLAWMALFAHYIYFTDFTGEVIYHGRPEETASNDDRSRYDRGVRAGSWGLLVNCIASSMYSLTIQWRVTSRFGQRFGLLLGIGTFAIAMAGLLVFTDLVSMLTLSALTGIAAAALDSIPYALACLYCENSQEYFKGSRYTPGVGQCLALLATAEYLSQVILTFLMGYIFSVTHTVASYVAVALVCALASCYASMFVVCPSPKDTS